MKTCHGDRLLARRLEPIWNALRGDNALWAILIVEIDRKIGPAALKNMIKKMTAERSPQSDEPSAIQEMIERRLRKRTGRDRLYIVGK
jgi:hypothetical protein